MTELKCKDCGNKNKFIATSLYRYEVNGDAEEITTPEMDEVPEYECKKCGSNNISITV